MTDNGLRRAGVHGTPPAQWWDVRHGVHTAAALLLLMPAAGVAVDAAGDDVSSVMERFVSRTEPSLRYRAWRRLEAGTDKGERQGWMEVITEFDSTAGMTYQVVAEGGSELIRNRVLHGVLKGEREAFAKGLVARAAITPANYVFTPQGTAGDGVWKVLVTPRRKDSLLLSGAIYLSATDADLVRIEGRLSKNPSFWTRKVDVIRRYARIAGIRLPVQVESAANVTFAGRARFLMTYGYESVNGQRVNSAPIARQTACARRAATAVE